MVFSFAWATTHIFFRNLVCHGLTLTKAMQHPRNFSNKKGLKRAFVLYLLSRNRFPFLIILSTASSRGKKVKATLIDILQKLFYLSTDSPYRISDWLLKSWRFNRYNKDSQWRSLVESIDGSESCRAHTFHKRHTEKLFRNTTVQYSLPQWTKDTVTASNVTESKKEIK